MDKLTALWPVASEDRSLETGPSMGTFDDEDTTAYDGVAAEVVAAVTDFSKEEAYQLQAPYKAELLRRQLEQHPPGLRRRGALIAALQDLGVKVFIIDSASAAATADVWHHVRRVVDYMARENYVKPGAAGAGAAPPGALSSAASGDGAAAAEEESVVGPLPASPSAATSLGAASATWNGEAVAGAQPLGYQRCLLYQDRTGRLFNLVVARAAVGPAAAFEAGLDRFSNARAAAALVLLVRLLPWALEAGFYESLQPALVALLMGLVLTDELSLSMLNATMLVRAAPSVSAAQALLSGTGFGGSRDAPRLWALFCLVLAGLVAAGRPSQVLGMMGIGGATLLLLVNLGARAWHALRWPPLPYSGAGAALLSYAAAAGTGLLLPFVAGRSVRGGGRTAVEHTLLTALIALAVVVTTGTERVQEAVLGMDYTPSQSLLDFVLGVWWLATALAGLGLAASLPFLEGGAHAALPDAERFLAADHASPAGYRVPCLPDFEVDPARAKLGRAPACLSLRAELVLGLLTVAAAGAAWLFLLYTDWDEGVANQVLQQQR